MRPALATSPRAARLFGRERVLPEIREALAGGAPVTLVGVAGVGKTELALHLAATAESAAFVDLSSAREPGDVLALVAHTLDVRVGREPMASLRAALAARAATLVLDRCDAARDETHALVAELAGACPVVSTASCPLELPDERVMLLEPLADDGVALFLARVERRAGAEPNPRERDAIRRIVELCGGLPFAIELAASVERPAVHVCDELELAVDRERALRGVIEWALASLDGSARAAVAQASAFEGPFSLDAFEAVVRLPSDVASVDVLSRAVSRGLVSRAPGEKDATRLMIAPQVRAVALELLGDAERLELLRRHAAWFAQVREPARADRLAAFEVALLDDTPSVLARLTDALVPVLLREGSFERAQAIVEAASAVVPGGISVARALCAEARGSATPPCEDPLVAAEIALRRDDPRAALALVAMVPLSSSVEAIRTLRAIGDAHRRLGAPREALAAYRGGVDIARRLDRSAKAAELLVRVAGIELDLGARDRAQPHLTEAIGVLARAGAERPLSIALSTLADLLLDEADEVGVDSLLVDARLHARRTGALDVLARVDVLAASRALGVGRVDDVPTLLAASMDSPGTWGDLARGLDAAYRARLDDRDGAADALPNGPVSAVLLGALELADARLARVQGSDAAALVSAARARLGADAPQLTEVRIARRVLARMLDQPAQVVVARDGAWFTLASVHVSFERRAHLRSLLAALLRRRIEAPGQNVPTRALVEAGWPGERLSARVLEDRLHTAMQTMRDLGLRPVLVHDGGWRLRAEIPIDVA